MQTNDDDGFDKSPDGSEMIALLRRHAPAPRDPEQVREAVIARLPRGRVRSLSWLAPAVGAAAVLVIGFFLVTQKPQKAPDGVESNSLLPTPAARGEASPQLAAIVRGPSLDGWRIDAGLHDGLRAGDILRGLGGEYAVSAVGIFDARVRGAVAPVRGEKLSRPIDTPPLQRALAMKVLGGDPGGFFDFGAVFEPMPAAQARALGVTDGRALRVVETIPAVLRDFAAEPEPTLAAKLGLRASDVIVQVNGYAISDLDQLAHALQWSRRSARLHATVIRNGRILELATH